ncbi:nonribosomal peptide synthase [Penicillium atrosanguineum]|uniref:Nonribosomal peptide synthase n=1 Tax=Penicillium atrosanguineum TaxID=1132637 RepID=A0A9W9U3R0_9EURO|nr:nonribosomal peptide synthase [Penicillium atrosanguineum]
MTTNDFDQVGDRGYLDEAQKPSSNTNSPIAMHFKNGTERKDAIISENEVNGSRTPGAIPSVIASDDSPTPLSRQSKVDHWLERHFYGEFEPPQNPVTSEKQSSASDLVENQLPVLSKPTTDIDATPEDLEQIWEWNSTVPVSVEQCVLDLINKRAQAQPSAPAICAWDGKLTHGELNQLATKLASRLVRLGVRPNTFVPLCFEKSMWTTVALIGVIKAGGAFVLLDPSLPEQRLQSIITQLNASVILSSTSNSEMSSRLAQQTVILDWSFFTATNFDSIDETTQQAHPANPESLLYAVFTSGSTGVPKGVLITNTNAASALHHQLKNMGINKDSRIFDFASYSFDVSISNVLTALTAGGCLCVPSNEDRVDNLEQSIASLKANVLDITPSIAHVLSPDKVPAVKTLIFGGEALHLRDIERWWGKVQIIHIYGPCECTPTSTINYDSAASPEEAVHIGKGVGLVTWIVDPEDHNILLPLGCAGELLLEGALVGRGYLNDPSKTADAFIEDPLWLLRGSSSRPGRRGRLYKTGDLVRYTEDGHLKYVGRKQATQVKIRGQRMELGEIEHALRNHAHVDEAVAVLQREDGQEPRIVSFVTIHDGDAAPEVRPEEGEEVQQSLRQQRRRKAQDELHAMLKSQLPAYMLPQAIEVLDSIPLNRSGKIDRQMLVKCLKSRRTTVRDDVRQPTSEAQRQMVEIWGRVLSIEASTIGLDDSFLHLGGSSITSMKLVTEARKIGMKLTVADIFRYPVLHELVNQIRHEPVADNSQHLIAPFALIDADCALSAVLQEISRQYHLDQMDNRTIILDAYPCTPLQEGLMSLTSMSPGSYIGQNVLELSPDISVENLRAAWEQVVRDLPILRTRIVQNDRLGLVQIVTDTLIHWIEADCLDEYLEFDIKQPMDLGQPLVRYALVKDGTGTPKWFVWTTHHALYDGWSMSLVLDAVKSIARGEPVEQGPQFQAFIKYVKEQDDEMMNNYWLQAYDDCHCAPFPSVPPHIDQPTADGSIEHCFRLFQSNHLGITRPIIIRAAWALLVGRMINADDVVFGVTLFGRNAPLVGIEMMAGPTFATVPVRVKWESSDRAAHYLNAVQQQATGMIAYEQIGLHKLAQVSPAARQACMFQTLLVVQPPGASEASDVFGRWRSELDRGSRFDSYGLMLVVQLSEDEARISASFDSRMIDPWLVGKLLKRLGYVVSQLDRASPELLLSEVETTTPEDLEQIWKWNHAVPVAAEQCVHHIFEQRAQSQPTASAVCAWDGEWAYGELDEVSTRLAHYLASLGVRAGGLVPLCFEKSRWTPVAMLAVMKAGGASVAMDSTQPEERLRTIVQQTEPKLVLVLSSSANRELASRLSGQLVVVIDESLLDKLSSIDAARELPTVTPSDTLYVAFTSGSTGRPKGAVITHSNFSSAIQHVRNSSASRLEPTERVYDFASYAFDICWFNALQSLTNGACLCIPSEADRSDDLAGSIYRLRATFAILTPSTAALLPSETVRHLQTLMLAGEALPSQYAKRWVGLTQVRNGYGPCECTPITTAAVIGQHSIVASSIGTGLGVNTWVVQASNHNNLAPIGDVGELLLEGPLVGFGYFGDAEKTAAAFVRDPPWLQRGALGQAGRRGRLYKTGDLVRYNPDGSLVFYGRQDATQVKIRGQRVELGEVEHYVYASIPSARQVTAEVIMPADGDGQKRPTLAAFLVVDDEGASSSGAQVMSIPADVDHEISKRLPGYMVPTAYFSLGKLPINSSGKVDRGRLREIGAGFTVQQLVDLRNASPSDKRALATEMERVLQQIWARVLSVDAASIGADDSFFSLGGDSITAMQASAAARALNIAISTADILRNRTISILAAVASASKHQLLDFDNASAEEDGQPFELSPIQRLYVATQPDPNWCFDQSFFLKPHEPICLSNLAKAFATIVARHPMLRARFAQTSEGRWKQRVVDDVPNSFHLCQVLGNAFTRSTKAGDMRRCRERLNIETGPLLAAVLFDDAEGQSLFIAAHHLIIDLVSWRILLEEFEVLLTGYQLPTAPTTSFRTWCYLQAQYAAEYLDPQEAPSSQIQPPYSSYWGLDIGENVQGATTSREFVLDEASSTAIMGACNEAFGTRPVELMIAALVHSFSVVFVDRPPPTVFNEGHGREPWDDRIDLSRTVGWFTTIFPACAPRGMAVDLLDAVRHAKDSVRRLPKNGWSYFTSKFADETHAATSAADFPVEALFNYSGSYQQLERGGSFFENISTSECSSPESWSKLRRLALFEFNGHMDKGRLAMSLEYPKSLHHSDMIEAWIDTYEVTLMHLSTLLKGRPSEWTLSDFPMAFTSYADMHEFQSVVLPRLGITSAQELEDIYPCSGLQEGLLLAQGKSSSDYRVILNFEIAATQASGDCVDLSRIEWAWGAVVRRHALLRAVLVDIMPGSSRTMHIVLKDSIPNISYNQWAGELGADRGLNGDKVRLKYGKYDPQHHLSLSRIDEKHVNLCFELSHAILDGHSTGVLLRDFWQAYTGTLSPDGPSYGDFIRYVEARPRGADREFWVKYLDGVQPCLFPPSKAAREQTRDLLVAVPGLGASGIHNFCAKWEVTAASVIQTAWALVLHHYTGSATPCFGNLISGRHVPVDRVEDMFGPVIGMIPYRVQLRGDHSVIATLREAQTGFVNSLSHQTPLMEIHEALHVGSSGLFNSILSFQRDIKQPSQSTDGHTIQERGGYDPVEYPIALSVNDNGTDVSIELSFKAGFIANDEAERVARVLGATVFSLIKDPEEKVSSVSLLPGADLERVWAWNSDVPRAEERFAHNLVEEQARRRPDAAAVCAWDGELTYKELDTLADHLARHLASMNVGPGVMVPLCFEKSVWTPVAALSVLKAGAGFALLSPSLPEQRLLSIVQQLEATVILSSSSNLDLSSRLSKIVVQVGPESANVIEGTTMAEQTLLTETPSARMYAVFTSGSTGTPKGVVLSHSNFCSGLAHQSHLLGFNESSRVFDFASYAFDISVHNIFATLATGGCLCIPAEKDLRDNISGSMADFKATLVDLTPSVARLIDPATVPEIETIIMAGEAVSIDDAKRWWNKARIVNAYGPAECSIISTVNWRQSCAKEVTFIGKGAGLVTWVVDPENHDLLLPPGCIGELLLEGPLVGRGYLGDKIKTDVVFIDNPVWLLTGSPGKQSGRHGRLYKTGDLVRYNEDGNLVFCGRKQDTQVKIRGQRVELGEIQHWVHNYMPGATHVVAEVIKLQGDSSSSNSLLVIFLQLEDKTIERDVPDATVKMLPVPSDVEGKLAEHLPAYMMPSILFFMSSLPMTVTGKIDRKRLRDIGAQFSIEQLAEVRTAGRGPKRQPTCDAERIMQNIWAKVLNIDASTIGLNDSFFRLGGDSISSMRLVGEARKFRMNVTVADVFRRETLAQLVRGQNQNGTETVRQPDETVLVDFCTKKALLEELDSTDLSFRSEDVADILPVTSVQERSFIEGIYPVACGKEHNAVGTTTCGRFANYMYLDLGADTDVSRLEKACTQTLDRFSILRACFLPLQGKLWQVVLHKIQHPFRVQDVSEDLDIALRDFCLGDAHTVSPTQPPLALVLLRRKVHGMRLVIRISHAQYDGICLPTIIQSFMNGNVADPAPPTFSKFLSYSSHRHSESISYWTEVLRGSCPTGLRKQLLAQGAIEKRQLKDIHLRVETNLPRLPDKITPATLASTAWALLLSRLTGQDDVVYGHLVAGRNSAISGMEEIVGCCLDFIPVRVKLTSSQTPADLMLSVQEQFLAVGEADSLGYKEIAKNCTDWPAGSSFESTIQHQNIDENPNIRFSGGTSRVQFFQNPHLIPMSVHMVSYTQGDTLCFELASNTHIMAMETANAMVEGLVRIIGRLDTDMNTSLSSWTKDTFLVG